MYFRSFCLHWHAQKVKQLQIKILQKIKRLSTKTFDLSRNLPYPKNALLKDFRTQRGRLKVFLAFFESSQLYIAKRWYNKICPERFSFLQTKQSHLLRICSWAINCTTLPFPRYLWVMWLNPQRLPTCIKLIDVKKWAVGYHL